MNILYYRDEQVTLYHGDALEVARTLPDGSADCIVTSPPYFGLRDYGIESQYGLEESPSLYVARMRRLFSELHRVLADDGTLWLNIGFSYKNKSLIPIPWMVANTLSQDGWILRNAVVWHKPDAMPQPAADRLTNQYEPIFLFSKNRRYWFNLDEIRVPTTSVGKSWLERKAAGEPGSHGLAGAAACGAGGFRPHPQGSNPGDVWTISAQAFNAAHFAVYPIQLPQRCIAAGCKPGGTVLDPFSGSGTTGLAAQRLGRKYVGIDLNAEYLDLSLKTRLRQSTLDFEGPA